MMPYCEGDAGRRDTGVLCYGSSMEHTQKAQTTAFPKGGTFWDNVDVPSQKGLVEMKNSSSYEMSFSRRSGHCYLEPAIRCAHCEARLECAQAAKVQPQSHTGPRNRSDANITYTLQCSMQVSPVLPTTRCQLLQPRSTLHKCTTLRCLLEHLPTHRTVLVLTPREISASS
jgi:hypothetical protein